MKPFLERNFQPKAKHVYIKCKINTKIYVRKYIVLHYTCMYIVKKKQMNVTNYKQREKQFAFGSVIWNSLNSSSNQV